MLIKFMYFIVHIPSAPKKELTQFLTKVSSLIPGLHVVDVDISLINLVKDHQKLEQVALGREFHISLGRTVPIRVHQIDSVVAMLRQKLQFLRRSVYGKLYTHLSLIAMECVLSCSHLFLFIYLFSF